MTFTQEISSWFAPKQVEVSSAPEIGQHAPTTDQLRVPSSDGKPQIITFLRHCGCPFAEKTFKDLREIAAKHPDVRCVAISHSSKESTLDWVNEVGGDNIKPETPGGPGSEPVRIIVDEERKIYGQWGLGVSSWLHVLSPGALYSVFKLGVGEGVWNRPTSSGSRWQTAGTWVVDDKGIVRWGRADSTAADMPDIEEALRAIAK